MHNPVPVNWATVSLPDTWPDSLNLRRPRDLWRFARHALGLTQAPVQLPDGVPGNALIPKYILQEFHNLPNGNYSRRFTRGYITGFNKMMLGEIARSHQAMAAELLQYGSVREGRVLDVGCGGGGLAGTLRQAGAAEVWGLDPSPYLLQHAAKDWPGVHFVQGVAENTGFSDGHFNAVAACFLLHEIPPRYIRQCLTEFARILQPGGLLSLCEPSPLQMQLSLPSLLRRFGWRGAYFAVLAHRVHEPFIQAWHKQDFSALLAEHGFTLLRENTGMPMRHWLAQKTG